MKCTQIQMIRYVLWTKYINIPNEKVIYTTTKTNRMRNRCKVTEWTEHIVKRNRFDCSLGALNLTRRRTNNGSLYLTYITADRLVLCNPCVCCFFFVFVQIQTGVAFATGSLLSFFSFFKTIECGSNSIQ